MITQAVVDRLDTDTIEIRWKSDTPLEQARIFQGDTPQTIDMAHPVDQARNGRAVVKRTEFKNTRPCFAIVAESGDPFTVAERRVPLAGTFNFRDLGGYPTTSGHRTRWGAIFRSDALGRLTDPDHELLKKLEIRLVCDFRSGPEQERSPDRLPEDGSIQGLHLPVVHGDLDAATAFKRAKNGDMTWLTEDFMTRGYLNNIESFPQVWGAVLQRLADPENRPMVFHCSAGKDRAGTCAALILLALGVPEETVIADHALSNVFIQDIMEEMHQRLRSRGIDPVPLAPYFEAPKAGIQALVDHIHGQYGSAAAYLVQRCGVTESALAALREDLLE
jgi:protein-tyrosine phosphatase